MKHFIAICLCISIFAGCATTKALQDAGQKVVDKVANDADKIGATVVANASVIAQVVVQNAESAVLTDYTAKQKDCLWSVAKAQYNDSFMWPVIYWANAGQIGTNPNRIKAGITYLVPQQSPKQLIDQAHQYAYKFKQ